MATGGAGVDNRAVGGKKGLLGPFLREIGMANSITSEPDLPLHRSFTYLEPNQLAGEWGRLLSWSIQYKASGTGVQEN